MASKSNPIQLFALQVPTQISLPFDLYALAVPQHWKELFNRLQQHKLGKNHVLPPVECLNQVLQLLVDGILFSSPNAFRLKSTANWLYFNADNIDTAYIAIAVKTWLNVSFENCNFLTDDDIAKIHAISGSDLQIEKVQLPTPIWEIKDASIKIDSLYYDLIPYLLASEVARSPLTLINPRTNEEFEKVNFSEIVSVESGAKEVISWPPMLAVKTRKKKDSEEKETITHYYSYFLKFVLHYSTGGEPYIICDCGIKRWVSWEFTYLRSGATVCIKPTKSTRFAACKLKYMGKEKGIDFESNLARLVKELNFRDKFTAQDVIQIPCKNDELACKNDGLVWAVTYSNTMSRSHNTDVGWFPIDHEIFLQACLKRFENVFEGGFSLIETYSRCENRKALTKATSEYKKVEKFIKSHFAEEPKTPPFYIPPNLNLLLLAQDTPSEKLIFLLAKKYGISNVVVRELGSLGAELLGNSWSANCSSRIKDFQKKLSLSTENTKTVTLVEILPKDHFWRDASKDPKPCFRPALAMLGSVTDHFEPKDEEDTSDFLTTEDLNSELMQREAAKEAAKQEDKEAAKEAAKQEDKEAAKQEDKTSKAKSLKSDFAYRLEATLLSGLSMAGAYVYSHFDTKNFPQDVASIGVYVIPYYQGEKTKYLPVAVRMDKTGVAAKAYGFNEWLDFHSFQVKMASGSKDFHPFDFNKNNIQSWVFNNLFSECKRPTLFCFDAANVRTKGLIFLQKKFWQKHLLAFDTGENMGIGENMETGKNMTFIPLSKYPHVRIAGIISPNTSEVPLYRVCDEGNKLAGHTAGVFYPSSQNAECGYYYLSNQRPESRSSGILQKSKLIPMAKTKGEKKGELKKPKPYAQGYNPRGVFLNLTLQEGDCFSDWASFVQCLRLYGLIHYLGATTLPGPLHLAAGLDDYRPIQAIREP